MNRRGFIDQMIQAGIAAAFLPSALTYERKLWRPPAKVVWEIDWSDVFTHNYRDAVYTAWLSKVYQNHNYRKFGDG